MKKGIRVLAGGLVLGMTLFLLCACGKKNAYAMKVGDQTVSENDYYRNVLTLRTNYLSSLKEDDSVSLWTDKMDDGSTMSDVFVNYLNDYLIDQKLYSVQFDQLGLSFSDTEEQTINKALSEAVENAGGMSTFTQKLSDSNYTYDEYLEEVYDSAKKSKVLAYYYGEDDGVTPVPVQDVKDYYNVHNARVKLAFILKIDKDTREALSDEALAAAKQKAADAYTAATAPSDTDRFEDVISLYSDDTSTLGDGVVIAESSGYDDTLTSTALSMEVGDVKQIEITNGYVIIKRYDGTADSVFTATIRQAALEEMKADDISAMLDRWKANTTVKINTKITKKYLPEKLVEQS